MIYNLIYDLAPSSKLNSHLSLICFLHNLKVNGKWSIVNRPIYRSKKM